MSSKYTSYSYNTILNCDRSNNSSFFSSYTQKHECIRLSQDEDREYIGNKPKKMVDLFHFYDPVMCFTAVAAPLSSSGSTTQFWRPCCDFVFPLRPKSVLVS